MNLTRLVALGLLAERGERHGHQLRRDVEVMKADQWAGAGIGSLNRELRLMAAEGLIEVVRTERIGRRPERTVYQITDEGVVSSWSCATAPSDACRKVPTRWRRG